MVFDKDKTIRYWAESAAYDVETGKSLLEAEKFPYALFFAHLAIEKLLKAIVVERKRMFSWLMKELKKSSESS
jgi:HEPN domain-containing protein